MTNHTMSRLEANVQAALEAPICIERARAMRWKERIEGYWRERGYFVDVRIADDGEIQSDLVLSAVPEGAA